MRKSSPQICLDMTLPPWMRAEARKIAIAENPENGGRGALVAQKKWAPGRVLRVRFMDGQSSIQARVREMAVDWMNYANIEFAFGNDPDAEIRISFTADTGSWSFMGTDNLSIPKNRPTMNFGWLRAGTTADEYSRVVKHEFGHMLGLIHEHQHPKVEIPWDKPAVYEQYMRTQGWTKEEVDFNLFQKYSVGSTQFSAYDKDSIMHYPVDENLTVGNFSIGWNRDLSPTDKAFIATVYPGKQPDTTVLTVGAAPVQGSIGAHGEQDVYRFTATKKGVYIVETQGATDVFVSLYDASDRLVTEDDDSGSGTNARIVSTLPAGSYTVKVRHYQPKGTGPYTISVTRG